MHGFSITVICHCHRPQHQFGEYVLKTAPNRWRIFGIARKMLYLCIVERRERPYRSKQHAGPLGARGRHSN